MREIGEDSKSTPAPYRARPRDATFRGGESPPPRGDQCKKVKKKKRDKSSWKNGGFGAVNPKLARGFLKTTQVSNLSGRRMKIQEIPFFRDATQWLPAVNKKSLKAATLPTAKRLLLTLCTVEPTSYETDRGKRVIVTPVKAKKASSVQGLPILRLEPELAVVRRDIAQLPPTCSLVTQPIVTSSAAAHPVSRPPERSATPPLITAVLQCDYRALERLLKDRTVNVNDQDADGRTALHHAVRQNDLEAIKRLLLHPNVDPNVQDNLGNRPFGELKSINKGVLKNLMPPIKIEPTTLNQSALLAGRINQAPLLKQTMSISQKEEGASGIQKSLVLRYTFIENTTMIRDGF